MKTREQNRNNKRREIERFDWFFKRIQTRVAFGWLTNARVKKRHAWELSQNQSILHFDVILQHDWPIEQSLLHITVFFGGKTKRPCFDLLIHWLIKQITNTCRNHFSRSYENLSTYLAGKSTISALLDRTFFRTLVLLSSNLTKLYENRQNMKLSLIVHS